MMQESPLTGQMAKGLVTGCDREIRKEMCPRVNVIKCDIYKISMQNKILESITRFGTIRVRV